MGIRPALAAVSFRPSADRAPRRAELLAALAFLEGTRDPASWGVAELRDWFTEHLVETGCMMMPVVVTEHTTGTVALHGSSAHGLASHGNLPRMLVAARGRVLAALRGLISSPGDDRFLSAAIFTGRVRRVKIAAESRWVVRPETTATLSGIVIGLFAADILAHRDAYDRGLCICETCDRLTFHEGSLQRSSCPDHLPSVSGFMRRVMLDQDTEPTSQPGLPSPRRAGRPA